MGINTYRVIIKCDDSYITFYTKTLYDRVRLYGVLLNMYDEFDEMSIIQIPSTEYKNSVQKYGMYNVYVRVTNK